METSGVDRIDGLIEEIHERLNKKEISFEKAKSFITSYKMLKFNLEGMFV